MPPPLLLLLLLLMLPRGARGRSEKESSRRKVASVETGTIPQSKVSACLRPSLDTGGRERGDRKEPPGPVRLLPARPQLADGLANLSRSLFVKESLQVEGVVGVCCSREGQGR